MEKEKVDHFLATPFGQKRKPANPTLMNPRLIQSLTAAQSVSNTLVLGMPAGFVPLKQATPAPNVDEGEGN